MVGKPKSRRKGNIKAPFPYFGGKSKIADAVWERFGRVCNYVEPFFGSGAVLLRRPQPFDGTETVSDADGLLCNFWRAVRADPDVVAEHADWPVIENDLHARHMWLVGQKDSLQSRLEGDPEFYDAKAAGWWCWGASCWIGGGWCTGDGPWTVVTADDGTQTLEREADGGPGSGVNAAGVSRRRLHLGHNGQGVNTVGVDRKRNIHADVLDMMRALAERLRRVRVCCGDWSRVCGLTPTTCQGLTAVFLDPPYSAEAGRNNTIYRVESATVAHAAREWAIAHGDDPLMRIALCGYEGEHGMPENWECLAWKTRGVYSIPGSKGDINSHRERIWFSPHCVRPEENMSLFMRDGKFIV